MVVEDHQFHLTGATRIVNSMSTLDFHGGLGEAAAWLCLREDIYVALVRQTPLKTNLDTFLQSNVFMRHDDLACASRMIFLLAKVLSSAFSEDSMSRMDGLDAANKEVEDWFETKPITFSPIRYVAIDKQEGRWLPEIWMISPFHG